MNVDYSIVPCVVGAELALIGRTVWNLVQGVRAVVIVVGRGKSIEFLRNVACAQ